MAEVGNLPLGALPIMVVGLDTQSTGLGAIGMPGCLQLVRADAALFLANQAGTAPWSLAIPVDPMLHGVTLYGQALVVSAALQPLAVTNGAALTVGL